MADNSDLFQSVKEYLLGRSLAPGKKLDTEAELAKRFSVSLYRVRQVMTTLAQMGFIDRSPRRGSTVRPPDAEDVSSRIQVQMEVAGFDPAEFIEARVFIECSVMPLVVQRATPKVIAQLDEILRNMADCEGDYHRADQYDKAFHLLLLETCGNRVLQVFSSVLVTHFDNTQYHHRFRDANYVLDSLVQEHRNVLEAIRQRDAELAANAMRVHLLERGPVVADHRPRGIKTRRPLKSAISRHGQVAKRIRR